MGLGRFAILRRSSPLSRSFGFDRGQPIDRYYIEAFLARQAAGGGKGGIRGRILEVGDRTYARRFSDPETLERIDVLDLSRTNPAATIVADIADAPEIASNAFDCVICTQTLHLVPDVPAALGTIRRILRPGGTLLVTVPGISQVCRPRGEPWEDQWRFTTHSIRRLVEEWFDSTLVIVEAYGNVLAASAFLYGLATQDLTRAQLQLRDPDYELLIAVKATK